MKTIEGNILDITEGIIAHQVNCIGVMGAGLALAIKNKYPKAFEAYKNMVKSSTVQDLLGYAQPVYVRDKLTVLNIFAQVNIGIGKVQTDYDALDSALERFSHIYRYYREHSSKSEYDTVYFPYGMGCGLGGGDWSKVFEIIEKHFPDAVIVKYNKI